MHRLIPLVFALGLFPAMAPAQTIAGIDWQLLAIDGSVTDIQASLRIEEDGTMTGSAPCNRWAAANEATMPSLQIRGIRATRRACEKLEEEALFFNALSLMTTLQPDGDHNLILTGPEGRSLEFVLDPLNSLTVCKSCKPID